ncbi:RxLR effector protein [Phytophthora megakarya]|uniref:RxLR effector protein n=1 Tax=Phytophthora megakarya TaxID=4795 RepID=A0A225UY65_9STRA|nr:RxLR effector protein [Phytophthora megakarya]
MRLSRVLVVIVTSFLFTSDALTVTNQTKFSKISLTDSPNQRHLRAHHSFKERENLEERGLTKADWKYLMEKAQGLGFDLKKSMKDIFYQQRIPKEKYLEYQNSLNRLIQERKSG